MSEVIEQHTCGIHHGLTGREGKHEATFEYPVNHVTLANVYLHAFGSGALDLIDVRDLHTFFAQLEEEMVRRMPRVEAAPSPYDEGDQSTEVPF